ncbi:VCBS repeat-containing protein [Mariniblastus sp.]|nr:VCBS repeat-containing protein [Mariniblastus sp.]MDB4372179.1 VCBS repeat-containing protein [Mariniblastus sp.]MDC0294088.1 VCBS repeat-containing protein [Mariniblastus sp.]
MHKPTSPRKLIFRFLVCLLLHISISACQGNEPWQRHVIDSSPVGADGVRLADFNRDGRLDVVTGWEESGVIRLYLNPGPSKSKQRWPYCEIGKGQSPEDAVPFDVDGDGILEVISCHEGNFKQVLIHKFNANSNFRLGGKDGQAILDPNNWTTRSVSKLAGQKWMFATPIQLKNSRRGIVIGSKGSQATLTLLIQPDETVTDLNLWLAIKIRDCGWIMSIQNIDMDQDGDIDIVFSDRKTDTRVVGWLEQPNGNAAKDIWKVHQIGATETEPMFIDATPNRILVATRKSNWIDFRRVADGAWTKTLFDNPPSVPLGKAIRQFGDDNIVLTANTAADKAQTDQPGLWLKTPGAQWKPIGSKTECKFDRIELIDLDDDGDLDVLTCEERKQLGVVWYENPGVK